MAVAKAAGGTTTVDSFTRKRPSRKPFPEHLPRERVVVPGPTACNYCGRSRLSKLGEDITETLEVIPKSWKVIQHVREKFTCRDCEKISQAPASFHVIARGWAGPSLLAMVLFEKFSQHRPLNRQAERYAREGMPISLSTLADQVGGCTAALAPLFKRLEAHVLSAGRLHGDDTRVPVLAKGKTDTGRMWVYVRDDKAFGGPEPPGAVFYYSRDRVGEHPQAHLAGYSGINTADISARSLNRNVKPIAAANKDAASGRQTAVITSVALMPRGRGHDRISLTADDCETGLPSTGRLWL
jgi:transposase